MLPSRRRLFTILAGAAGVLATESLLCSALHAQFSPQPIPSPHAPNQNFPPGLDGPDPLGPEVDLQASIREDGPPLDVRMLCGCSPAGIGAEPSEQPQ